MKPLVAVVLALAIAAAAGPARAADDLAPDFAIPTTADGVGRVMAPVYVNGQGPYRFVVDTGANRSVLSPRLAEQLRIDTARAPQQLVHGVTGAEAAPIVRVGALQVGRVSRSALDLPVLSNRLHAGADGTLGADHLSAGRLVIDFRADKISVLPSSAPTPLGYVSMTTQMRFGQLPLVWARIGNVNVRAVVDTGAERSVANSALRRLLEANRTRLAREGMQIFYGAVGPEAVAELVWAPRLTIGGIRVERMPILFADTHIFRLWGLENEPALLLGMDVIGQFDAIIIDYRRRLVSVRLPRVTTIATRRAAPPMPLF